jgi:hypothetical protein
MIWRTPLEYSVTPLKCNWVRISVKIPPFNFFLSVVSQRHSFMMYMYRFEHSRWRNSGGDWKAFRFTVFGCFSQWLGGKAANWSWITHGTYEFEYGYVWALCNGKSVCLLQILPFHACVFVTVVVSRGQSIRWFCLESVWATDTVAIFEPCYKCLVWNLTKWTPESHGDQHFGNE